MPTVEILRSVFAQYRKQRVTSKVSWLRIATCEHIPRKVRRTLGSLCRVQIVSKLVVQERWHEEQLENWIAYEKFGMFFICFSPLSLEVAASGSSIVSEILLRLMAGTMAETVLR